MVMLQRLTHIDHIDGFVVIEQVVLAEIGVDQSASLVHPPDDQHGLLIAIMPVAESCILQPWCR